MAMDPAIREADGVKVRFAEGGQGGSETVVLTSPWPESLFAFRKVWDRLAGQFHVVAIDLPGFGQSERQLDLLSPPAMGAFLVAVGAGVELGSRAFRCPRRRYVRRLVGCVARIRRWCAAWPSAAGLWPFRCRWAAH